MWQGNSAYSLDNSAINWDVTDVTTYAMDKGILFLNATGESQNVQGQLENFSVVEGWIGKD